MKKFALGFILLLALCFVMVSLPEINIVKASGTIYIRSDGSVEGTDKIQRDGNVYTFTDDINGSIVVEKDSIVIDGASYALQGNGSGRGIDLSERSNVIVKNMQITHFYHAIYLPKFNNTFSENYIANNDDGFWLLGCSNNTIIGNTITNNNQPIYIAYSSAFNVVTENNMINNFGVVIIWLEGPGNIIDRNYWSEYNGTDNDGDGIGDTPHTVINTDYATYMDYHPLMNPVVIPEFPSQIMSFEEALEAWSSHEMRPWEVGCKWFEGFKGEPFVTADGLTIGYLGWYAGNASIFEAIYPSGELMGEVDRRRSVPETETYYVWHLEFMDGGSAYVDARNGDVLEDFPGRFPGTLTFKAAVRVVNALQPKVEEWSVQKYERIADYEYSGEETSDGSIRGHLLRRAADGSLYEYSLPVADYPLKEVLRIQVSNDTEEYTMWEITTQNKTYYIDARNGLIRLILSDTTDKQFYALSTEAIVAIAATIVIVIAVATFTLKKCFSKEEQRHKSDCSHNSDSGRSWSSPIGLFRKGQENNREIGVIKQQ